MFILDFKMFPNNLWLTDACIRTFLALLQDGLFFFAGFNTSSSFPLASYILQAMHACI